MEEVSLPTLKAKASITHLRVSATPSSRHITRAQLALQARLQDKAGIIPSSPSKAIKVNLVISSPTLDLDMPRNRHLRLSMCLYSSYPK